MELNKLILLSLTICTLASCSSRHTPAPVIESKTPISTKKPHKASISSTSYKVKRGETLYSIAWRAKTDVRTLASLNKLTPPYRIFPEQVLILSANSAKPSSSKGSAKNSTKSSGSTSTKVNKKPVAPIKKPEYGKVASGQKTSKKTVATNQPFSQKIRKWRWPAQGKVIASFSTAVNGNKGIDIAGRRGDRITAAADGQVVYAGNALRGYGKLIIIKHNDDYLSAYAHNDEIFVKEQQYVKAGESIAKMGDTESQRVMLHFEVRFRGKPVNPKKYLPRK